LSIWPESGGSAPDTGRSVENRVERQLLHLANSHTRPLADLHAFEKQSFRNVKVRGAGQASPARRSSGEAAPRLAG